MALTWKALYSTGMPSLDQQHRTIFGLINRLGELVERRLYDSPEVDDLLDSLGAELHQHFEREEGCMRRHHCPMAEKNRQEHQQLLGLYQTFRDDFQCDKKLATLSAFQVTASDWLLEHVCFVDIHLRSCVGSKHR